jgi:transcriptional regulator with XRE-family HTH domain|nr:MAG TPA: helix-turn-helix domain protein [Caudoviricetes sp.]DAU13524.1 MAG TPA: helix-turn-helix domain protein [Caudoviricetes sp.]
MKRQWLIDKRHKKDLSQAYVARECNISQQMYCYIEIGKKRPGVELAKKIADVLNFSWSKFYE